MDIKEIEAIIGTEYTKSCLSEIRNFSRSSLIEKLYKFINSLNIDYTDIIDDIVKKILNDHNTLNDDVIVEIHMNIINTVFNMYLNKTYNIPELFGLKEIKEIKRNGTYCPGCVYFYLSEFPKVTNTASFYNKTYWLNIDFNEYIVKPDDIKDISYNDINSYFKHADLDTIINYKKKLDEFEKTVNVLVDKINEFLERIEHDYELSSMGLLKILHY